MTENITLILDTYSDNNQINTENIPTKTSDLINDSGFITSSSLPTKTSDLTNDSGFLTSHQDISGKANISYVNEQLEDKQDTLTAGANITISNNVISASGGGGGGSDIATDTLNNKLESYILRGEVVDINALNTLLQNKIQGVS